VDELPDAVGPGTQHIAAAHLAGSEGGQEHSVARIHRSTRSCRTW
jgi:hypothetical protein